MKTIIYTLSDPITKEIKYVGKTRRSIEYRFGQHIAEAVKGKMTHKNNWIRSILSKGLLPLFEEIDNTETDWEMLEMYWVAQLKSWGFDLTNMISWETQNYYKTLHYDLKKQISNKLKGRSRPQEVRDKISKSHKGKIISETEKQRLRTLSIGIKHTIETKSKRYKSVIQLTLDDKIVKIYPSVTMAQDECNCAKSSISAVALGKVKTACGYKWSYKI